MDGALAAHFGWMESKQKAALFLLGYVAMAVLVVGFWFIAPAISFIIFLAISMYHFGKGDVGSTNNQFTATESLARGGLVIAGISQFHASDADSIFKALVGSDTELVWLFLDAALAITIACCGMTLLTKTGQERVSSWRNCRINPYFRNSTSACRIFDLFLSSTLDEALCNHESNVG